MAFNFLRQLTNSEPEEEIDSPVDEKEGDVDGESDIEYDERRNDEGWNNDTLDLDLESSRDIESIKEPDRGGNVCEF